MQSSGKNERKKNQDVPIGIKISIDMAEGFFYNIGNNLFY